MHERPETHAPEEGVARDARDAAYALGSPREPPLHADARRVGGGEREHAEVGSLAEARHQRVPQPRPRDDEVDQEKESAGEEQRDHVNQSYVTTFGDVAMRLRPALFAR